MENKENLEVNTSENVEQTTEETQQPKTYTQEEVDAIVGKAKARAKAKIEKDYNRKYGDLMDTLKAGTGKEDVEELNDTFTKFYESKGIKINKKPNYSTKDIETLATAEANEIINAGYEDVVEEVDRLAEIGAENMTAREKAVYKALAEHRQKAERSKELAKIGVTDAEYNSPEFKEFASMFRSDIPITKVYDQYRKSQPKKEIKPMGSMKNTTSDDNGVKDFYTIEEARKFTNKDFENNPKLFEQVVKSSHKWGKNG
jgi:hypothetical protein